ncbi:ABC-2 family transporter protein [Candidatus Roizmanbacteria bacterium]|nr:ABC-2 family transporter protein [Candidatus Roizmanbacteria bacterium]
MKQYLAIYKTLLKLNFTQLVTYRENFLTSIFTSTLWGAFSFLLIILLTAKTPEIHGWKREELLILMGFYNIVIGGFFHMFFSRNFDHLANTVHFGQLDSILLKPVDSQFLVSTGTIAYWQVTRIIMGLTVVLYLLHNEAIKVTVSNVLVFTGLSVFGLLLLYSIWFTVMTLTIWHSRLSNLVYLLYHFNDLARFPPEMFRTLKSFVLPLLPYFLVLVVPTKVILHKLTVIDTVLLISASLLFLLLSRKFWKFALRYYTSASS